MPPKKSKTSDAKVPKTSSRKRKRENGNDLPAKVEEKKSAEKSYSHWIMKSEPESRFENGVDLKFGIEDLKKCKNQTDCWDGVRNYQARNFMRDQMKIGHKVFFYHSNCKEPGIAGICKIVKESYVDHTQFDSKDPHYDRSAKKDAPKWFMVDVKFERMLKRFIPLSELKSLHLSHKADGGTLKNMALFTRARLSVQPVTQGKPVHSYNYMFILSQLELLAVK